MGLLIWREEHSGGQSVLEERQGGHSRRVLVASLNRAIDVVPHPLYPFTPSGISFIIQDTFQISQSGNQYQVIYFPVGQRHLSNNTRSWSQRPDFQGFRLSCEFHRFRFVNDEDTSSKSLVCGDFFSRQFASTYLQTQMFEVVYCVCLTNVYSFYNNAL